MKVNLLFFSWCMFIVVSCRKSSDASISFRPLHNDSSVVDGYMDHLSYGSGDKITYYINYSGLASNVSLGIYDINGQLVDTTPPSNLQPQTITQSEPYANGYGYQISGTYKISWNLPSGIYFLANKLPFLVKDSRKQKNPVLVVYPSNTDFAYNPAGGKSFYYPNVTQRTRIVSFLRPWQIESSTLGFLQWSTQLSGEGLQFDFITDMDLDAMPDIGSYRLIVIMGHSEYWTRAARLKISSYVNSGKNLLVLAANTFWWQARYDDTHTRLICYKFTAATEDPEPDPLLKTFSGNNAILQLPILPMIGTDYSLGGFHDGSFSFRDGYRVLDDQSPLLGGTGLKKDQFIPLEKTHEFDGTYVTYRGVSPTDSIPTPDNSKINFYRYELIGYTPTHLDGNSSRRSIATFIAGQRTPHTGTVVNVGCETWCGACMQGTKGGIIKTITLNCLKLLLNSGNVFSSGH